MLIRTIRITLKLPSLYITLYIQENYTIITFEITTLKIHLLNINSDDQNYIKTTLLTHYIVSTINLH